MTYDEAMESSRNGGKVKREGWPTGEYIYYHINTYIIQYAAGWDNSYVPSEIDMDEIDWVVT